MKTHVRVSAEKHYATLPLRWLGHARVEQEGHRRSVACAASATTSSKSGSMAFMGGHIIGYGYPNLRGLVNFKFDEPCSQSSDDRRARTPTQRNPSRSDCWHAGRAVCPDRPNISGERAS